MTVWVLYHYSVIGQRFVWAEVRSYLIRGWHKETVVQVDDNQKSANQVVVCMWSISV